MSTYVSPCHGESGSVNSGTGDHLSLDCQALQPSCGRNEAMQDEEIPYVPWSEYRNTAGIPCQGPGFPTETVPCHGVVQEKRLLLDCLHKR